jgi:hypothetical protein|tara:strand:- start:3537 stop:4355 length:819 start_codon:yes stop_codon:yes gene_type:complete
MNKMNDLDVCKSLLSIIDEMYEADGITPIMPAPDPREACHSKTHDCATKVIHPKWGEGKPMYESHAVPTNEGYVAWYDVEFDHGIEKEVPAQDMEIITLAEHGAVNASEFKPHMMFHPETGEAEKAEKPEDHERLKKKGYTHEKPKKVDEAMSDAYGMVNAEPEQLEGSVEFKQHKNTANGSVSIEASADDMQELAKVLKLAGLTLPKEMHSEPEGEPEEEDVLMSPPEDEESCDDEEGKEVKVSVPGNEVPSDAKQTLVNIIKDKLQQRLK